MDVVDIGRAISFEQLRPGTLFRGFIDDVPLVAMRASGHFGTSSDDNIAVLLSSGGREVLQAHVFHRAKLDQGTVMELTGAALLPSLDNSAFRNSYAEVGDIEFSHDSISLIVKLPARGWSSPPHRLDLRSGEIKTGTSAESIVSSQWSIIHSVSGQTSTIVQHKALLKVVMATL